MSKKIEQTGTKTFFSVMLIRCELSIQSMKRKRGRPTLAKAPLCEGFGMRLTQRQSEALAPYGAKRNQKIREAIDFWLDHQKQKAA